MSSINPISVQRAVENYLRDRITTNLTAVSAAIYGRAPEQLSRSEFGLMFYALKAANWRQHKDQHTHAKYWRGPQQAARTPIAAEARA